MQDQNVKPIVLVTGATGAVGPALVRRLSTEGYAVRVLTRASDIAAPLLPAGVQFFQGEITNSAVLESAAAGVDLVFHLASLLHINDPGPDIRGEYERVNVEGTRRIIEAARKSGVSRLIFFSTINVYGPTRLGQIVDETAPLNPGDFYSESKILGEELALSSMDTVVLRLAAVYGRRMKGNYLRALQALQKGRFFPVGPGSNRRTLVYDADVAGAALAAANHPHAAGNIFNLTDGCIHTLNDIIASMCLALGRPRPGLHLPLPLALFGFGLAESSFKLVGRRAPINRAMVHKIVEDIAVSGSKIQEELKFIPRYDLTSGWKETIAALNTT